MQRITPSKMVRAVRNPLWGLRALRSMAGFVNADLAPVEFLVRVTGAPRDEVERYYNEALSVEELAKVFQVADSVEQEWGAVGGAGIVGHLSLADAAILYSLILLSRPQVVVETGVAAGVSSTVILLALERTGGRLYSIDLPPEAVMGKTLDDGLRYDPAFAKGQEPGWLVPERLKERWQLVLGDVREVLPGLLKDLGQIDLFYHDDLHTPDHAFWEFKLVWPYLHDGGWLVVDDINYGWAAFLRKFKLAQGSDLYVNCFALGAVQKKSGTGRGF